MANISSINGNEVEAHYAGGDLREEIDLKADSDGYYTMLTAGAADNLTARGDGVTASFLYRTTAGSASVPDEGESTVRSINGRTLVWNQLNNGYNTNLNVDGLTKSEGATGGISVTGTVTTTPSGNALYLSKQVPLKRDGRKYLFKVSKPIGYPIMVNGYPTSAVNGQAFIWSKTDGTNWNGALCAKVGSGDVIDMTDVHMSIFDLTQMFGAGNEPSTVAEFEALYPLPYYPYDAGTLLPVRMTGVETTGFNQLPDGLAPYRGIPAFDGSKCVRLIAGQQYQLTFDVTSGTAWRIALAAYEMDGAPIVVAGGTTAISAFLSQCSRSLGFNSATGVFVQGSNNTNKDMTFTPSRDCYVLPMVSGNPVTTNACLHLVWSGYRNGEYEPYWSEQRTIAAIAENFPDGMRSAGSVADELTEYGAIHRVGERAYQSGDESDSTVTTDNTITHYPLATPTTTTFPQPISMNYKFADFGTERIMVPTGQMSAPPTMDVAYGLNATDTLRTLPTEYISKASDASFTAALAAALNLTITRTWDEAAGRYDYTITANGEE